MDYKFYGGLSALLAVLAEVAETITIAPPDLTGVRVAQRQRQRLVAVAAVAEVLTLAMLVALAVLGARPASLLPIHLLPASSRSAAYFLEVHFEAVCGVTLKWQASSTKCSAA